MLDLSSRSRSVYVAVLIGAGVLYGISCAPGMLWQDSGLIQYRVWHNDIEGFLGLALAHPLYYVIALVAKFIPVGSFSHRVNLVSAVAGAVAVANLYLLVRLWLGRQFPAIVAALTLTVSHTFWRHASIAETYTLWTALFLGELVVLLAYTQSQRVVYLYLLGLLNGLALAVHMLAIIPAACYAVVILVLVGKKAIRVRDVGVIVLCWTLGALPYEYLVLKTMVQTGDVGGTLASACFGIRWRGDVLNTALSGRIVRENLLFLALNFPTPNVLLFFVGIVTLVRMKSAPLFRGVLGTLALLFLVFAFRYTIADRYAFFIPFYAIVAILVGLGVDVVQQRVRRRVFAVSVVILAFLPAGVYATAATLARRVHLSLGTRGDVPYRDDSAYFLQPWKTGYEGAERFAREALASLPADAVIYADTTTVAPLLLAQEIWRLRSDVWVITGLVRTAGAPAYKEGIFRELMEVRPIYVTSPRPGYCPSFMLGQYDFVKRGLLWRVAVAPQSGRPGHSRRILALMEPLLGPRRVGFESSTARSVRYSVSASPGCDARTREPN